MADESYCSLPVMTHDDGMVIRVNGHVMFGHVGYFCHKSLITMTMCALTS